MRFVTFQFYKNKTGKVNHKQNSIRFKHKTVFYRSYKYEKTTDIGELTKEGSSQQRLFK